MYADRADIIYTINGVEERLPYTHEGFCVMKSDFAVAWGCAADLFYVNGKLIARPRPEIKNANLLKYDPRS